MSLTRTIPHNFKRTDGINVSTEELANLIARYPAKFLWFAQHGYHPHYWQMLFHTLTNPETNRLCRYRHLVAGRRGGKTLSAAWDVIFYTLHPEAFHKDLHGVDSQRPLMIWVVTQDYPMGFWALDAIRTVLQQAGLQEGTDYKENRGNRWIEFSNGSFLMFKTADEPNKLRGAGLDIMWFDESAFVKSQEAWDTARPALANKQGAFYSTTTPDGKNWHYNVFWSEKALGAPFQGRVEYWSIDSPYFAREEWETLAEEMHPLVFKREFMASFDAMAGKELAGDWLHYYDEKELDRLRNPDGTWAIDLYVAVDPAISLADSADRFAIACVGVKKDRSQAYLIDLWAGRIPFPEQVDKINQWYQKYSPQVIGIEKNAYQAALAQQVQRLEGLPPVAAIWARGKKFERILAMAPFFRTSRIKISPTQVDFINEWVDYDSEKKNPQDDCLDAVEMALRTAGIVLPVQQRPTEAPLLTGAASTASMWLQIDAAARRRRMDQHEVDEHLGEEW